MSKVNLSKFNYNQILSANTVAGQFPYTFVSNNSKKLLITIGDSWTWGADLTATDELDNRLNESFGGIIANELSTDYLNLGQCGSCNLHIIERIKELRELIPNLEYDEIIIILTYTEVARSINGPHDKKVDYCAWFENNNIDSIDDLTMLLQYHNRIGQEHIVQLLHDYPHVKIIIGNNFTDPIGIDDQLFVLPKTWVEVYNEQTTQKIYNKPCYIMSHWVIEKLSNFLKEFKPNIDQSMLKLWLMHLIDCANKRKELIVIDNKYYAGSNHPLQLGHQIWARYVLGYINE